MSWFRAFRNDYGFTLYEDNRTPVTIDFPLVIVIYLCVVLAAATLISTLGIRGRERWASTLRASYGVGIFSIILVCLVGHNWLEGETEIMTQYLYRSDNYFRGTVGLRIGLHGCNVTLSGHYEGNHGKGYVNYVESVGWKDYGHEQENLGGYLERGLPHPVLAVMDFLSVDSGGMRWGRNYHSAGYFAMALLWTALVFWVISQVLLVSVISYGSFMMFMTGTAMVLAVVVYSVCQPPLELRIYFGEAVLTAHYGWCYWLSLVAGITTVVLGLSLFILDHLFHEKVREFFNLDKLDEDDLPDYSAAHNKTGSMMSDKLSTFRTPGTLPRTSNANFSSRRSSMQNSCTGRKNSIFLEPERRPNEFGMRSSKGLGSVTPKMNQSFPSAGHFSSPTVYGVANRGFEQEMQRTKNNPLFSGSTSDILEVPEDTILESVFDQDDCRGSDRMENSATIPNRKPSLATMREHRENHMNERHQQQQSSASPSAVVYIDGGDTRYDNSSNAPDSECASVVIHCPNNAENIVKGTDDVRLQMTKMGNPFQRLTAMTGAADSDDSAFASGTPSPDQSGRSSACGDDEK